MKGVRVEKGLFEKHELFRRGGHGGTVSPRPPPASSTKVTTPVLDVTSSMVATLDLPASRSAQTFTARTSP